MIIMDTTLLVKKIPLDKEVMKDRKLLTISRKNQEVDKNELKFARKITVEAESRGIRKYLTMLNTAGENIKPLLGIDWLQKFNWTIRKIENTTTTNHQSKKTK